MVDRTVQIQYGRRLVTIFPQVKFQTVTVFSSVCAVSASILIDVCVRLHVTIQHRLKEFGIKNVKNWVFIEKQ